MGMMIHLSFLPHKKKKATMCGLYKTWKTMLKWLLPWKYEVQVLQSYLFSVPFVRILNMFFLFKNLNLLMFSSKHWFFIDFIIIFKAITFFFNVGVCLRVPHVNLSNSKKTQIRNY